MSENTTTAPAAAVVGRAIFEAIDAHPMPSVTWDTAEQSWRDAFTIIGGEVAAKLSLQGVI